MKQAQVTRKVPGGKLFRIELVYDRRIEAVKITGDFFLHPEETILELESCLEGVLLPAPAEDLSARMQAVLAESAASYRSEFIGEVLPVLWESARAFGPQGWQLSGLTDNYLRVTAHAPKRLWNQITPVRLTGVVNDSLSGQV